MNAGPISLTYRRYALGLLLAVNLLNYIDRQVLFAVFPLIKIDLRLSDTALGFLGSVFMFSYMILAPLFGWLGDHWSRDQTRRRRAVCLEPGHGPGRLCPRLPDPLGRPGHGRWSVRPVSARSSPGLITDFLPQGEPRPGSVLVLCGYSGRQCVGLSPGWGTGDTPTAGMPPF